MKTTMQGCVRAAALGVLLWAGVMAAPRVLAHDTPQPIAVTEGGSRVVAISAGLSHTCSLKADASIACWGDNAEGQAPASVTGPFTAVSAGYLHTCGLKPDGSASCWGYDFYGQAPASVAGPFTALVEGFFHTCGLKTDGTVACWGYNNFGQSTPPETGGFIALAAGYHHSCGLQADGNVACWGSNEQGQNPGLVSGPFVAVTARTYSTCALRADGSATCWGIGATSQPGPFTALASASFHTCGLKADGNAACWGSNQDGQAPPLVAGPFVALATGWLHSCGVKADGAVACWGESGSNNTLYNGQSLVPMALSGAGSTGFGQIAAGNAHACELKRDGTIACWGNNDEGQATAPAGVFTQVVAGDSHSCAIGSDSKVTCWGRNGAANTLALTDSLFANGIPGFEYPDGESGVHWKQLAPASGGAICALRGDNKVIGCTRATDLWFAGDAYRNITHGGNVMASCAVRASGYGYCASGFDGAHGNNFAGPWQRLESGLNHQCGLKANGSVECWGNNDEGQTNNVPTGLVRALSVGWNHACAIRDNSQLACWGSNLNGQADAPAGAYVQVAAGNTFTCAIRSDGERVCWGASPGNPASLSDLPNGMEGVAYSTQITISGPSAPTDPVFVQMSGTLPPGLTLSSAGLLSGTPTSSGIYTFNVDAEGTGGFAASRAYTVTIMADGTPPVITYTLNGDAAPPATPDGENGWYISNVAVAWTTSDAESGVASNSGCTPITITGDATGATAACSATNGVGLAASVTTVPVNIDITHPVIQAAGSPAANGNGWHNGNVTVSYTCSDATSGIAAGACPTSQTLSTEGTGIATTIQTVKDQAGNSGNSNVVMANIDKTAPTISAAATSATNGNNGWYTGNVTVAFTCNDALSGVVSCPGTQTLSAEGNPVSSTAQAIQDMAGNSATSNVVAVKIDKTAPTLAPTVPSPLLRGQSYVATPNASDATSGVASQSCGALDASSTGSKSTTCTATDNAGNVNTIALNYTVTTTCSNDGYSGTQLTWCRNICEMGYTGSTLETWIHRWVNRYRDLPYCRVTPQPLN